MLNVTFMTINQFVIPALPRHDTHQTARSSMPKYSTCFFFRGGLSSTVTDISKEIALVTQLLNLVSARVERKASSRLQSDSPEPGCGWWWLMELFPSFKVSHSFWLGIALVPFDTQLAQRRCSTFFVCHSHFHTNIRNAPPPEQRPPGLHLLTFFKINFLFDLFGVWWSSPAVKNELFDKVGNMTSSLKSSSYILIYFKILSKWEMLCVLTTVLPLITVRVCVCVCGSLCFRGSCLALSLPLLQNWGVGGNTLIATPYRAAEMYIRHTHAHAGSLEYEFYIHVSRVSFSGVFTVRLGFLWAPRCSSSGLLDAQTKQKGKPGSEPHGLRDRPRTVMFILTKHYLWSGTTTSECTGV